MSLWLVRDLLYRVNGKTAVIISSPVLQKDIKGGFSQTYKKNTFIQKKNDLYSTMSLQYLLTFK